MHRRFFVKVISGLKNFSQNRPGLFHPLPRRPPTQITPARPLRCALAAALFLVNTAPMKNDVVEVSIKGVMPTSNGCAIFLGNTDKTFVIYVDQAIGNAISMTINDVKKDRPLTHDLIGHIFAGLGVTVERVIINDVDSGTFFARIILNMQNELGRKVIEVDARPSDSMVLALQAKKPILVARKVLDSVDDMTEILERILKQQN
jgi:bifunctional DNase/RNase